MPSGKVSSVSELDAKYQEILTKLDALQQRPLIPLIDPTENVKELVKMKDQHYRELNERDQRRQDDLREQAERFNEKLYAERRIADSEAKRAEAGRIDALLVANTNNVALALEKQSAQAQAQDKRIAVLELNQYQGVGAAGQRVEGRQQNQWVIGILIVVGIFLANFLSGLMHK
jgi:hypothetical protein